MPIQTQVITGVLSAPDGTFLSGYFVRFTLSAYDATDNGVISATKTYTLPIQSDGSIAGDIWPNEAGVGGTFYQVHVLDDKQREREFLGKLQIGTDGPYDLADLIRSQSPTPNPSYIRLISAAEYQLILDTATASGGAAAAIAAQGAAETARDASAASAADSAQSASVATAAAAALVGTEGIIPTASEILWLASKPQDGVNALGFFDTGARLLSGVSERALLRYGEDNDTLNFMLLDGGVDGVRLDFTAEGAVFAAGGVAAPGDSVVTVLDQSDGLALGSELRGNGAVVTVGAAASGSYNTATGEAVLPRVDGSNLNLVDVTGATNGFYLVDIQNTGASAVTVRSGGTVLHTIPAGVRRLVAPKIASGLNLGVYPSANGEAATCTIHSIRSIAGTHATQPNAALQGKFGRAPKVVRNLLKSTEALDGANWFKGTTTVTANQAVAPDGSMTADQINFGASPNANIQRSTPVVAGLVYTFSIYLWSDAPVSNVFVQLDGALDQGINITTEPTRFDFQATASDTVFQVVMVTRDASPVSIYAWGAQLEEGATATPYQAVGASDLDVTESGVEGFGFYRPDLSDDVLSLTVPAIDGDILIAGKKGTWIEPAAPSAGAFNIGPTTYTGGTPGILRAVGDITGVELIDKTMSAEERARVIAYYTARGARGLLVPGPELVTNGGFDTDTAWAKGQLGAGPAATIAGGVGNIARTDGTNFGHLSQTVISPAGVFLVSGNFGIGGGLVRIGNAVLNTQYFVASFSAGPFERIIVTSGANPVVTLHGATDGVGATVDDFSMREYRPEEDW